ncbi:hypothetical protein KI387_023125 [Taxus chinensis]|uniref:U-box domain-containing protein n=1 Tax=Taxus chinensis TaxID=29808 RepID=A0AA38G4B1_TAXCH|nr:hypothetical protein KI387_023125 [Taxus chinensis]
MALLKALLDLGNEICACAKPKAFQRRNSSAITRRMQTEAMSVQFHQLTQDMATALDVLPLKLVDVTDEVREQVELLHKQSRRAGLFVENTQFLKAYEVATVLMATPWIDDYSLICDIRNLVPLQIYVPTWRTMGIQSVGTLDAEPKRIFHCSRSTGPVATAAQNAKKIYYHPQKNALLIGLVRYCKCVLFGAAKECYDKDEQQVVGFKEVSSTENIQVPDDFKCPISLDLMRDPAIVAMGLTYDRVSITR